MAEAGPTRIRSVWGSDDRRHVTRLQGSMLAGAQVRQVWQVWQVTTHHIDAPRSHFAHLLAQPPPQPHARRSLKGPQNCKLLSRPHKPQEVQEVQCSSERLHCLKGEPRAWTPGHLRQQRSLPATSWSICAEPSGRRQPASPSSFPPGAGILYNARHAGSARYIPASPTHAFLGYPPHTMSDTATIDKQRQFGLVAAVSANLDRLRSTIDALRQLHDQWQDNNGTIINVIAQLSALKANLGEMQDWMNYAINEMHPQLLTDLDLLMTSCSLLVRNLDALTAQLRQPDHDKADWALKLKFRVGSRSMNRLKSVAKRQTDAVSLLLAACKT